jgi:hypothetical protein
MSMNAKFERCLASKNFRVLRREDGCYAGLSRDLFEIWQAAIQSLEVTPQLCQIAEAAYDAEPATPLCDSPAMKEALQAFLSALKEQAK